MRLLIDLQSAQTGSRNRGIGRYSVSLAKAMIRRLGDEHEVIIILNGLFKETIQPIIDDFKGLLPSSNFLVFEVPSPVSSILDSDDWRKKTAEIIREYFISSLSPDIVHVTSLFEGTNENAVTSIKKFAKHIPTFVTLYDLIPLLNEEKYLGTAKMKEWYADKISSLLAADGILSISEYSKKEAITHLPLLDASKITNISSAADDRFKPTVLSQTKKAKLLAKFGIEGDFLLYAGVMEPRKNFEALIEAYSLLPKYLRDTYKLVLITDPKGETKAKLKEHISSLGLLEKDVITTGRVSDDELISLYSTCKLFVFASLHEGFGLPALEAMSCGAAVIGSNVTSIPEVIGIKEALFDPTSPADIASLITAALTNESFYTSLIANAKTQATKFSWDLSAQRALDAFASFHLPSTQNISYKDLIVAIGQIDSKVKPTNEDLVMTAKAIATNESTLNRFFALKNINQIQNWRIEGPFDSSYSLALLNRETARALVKLGFKVSLHSTEGGGDFEPSRAFLDANPDIKAMYNANKKQDKASIVSRNLYPPRVADMNGILNMLHHYAWEESAFPDEWCMEFNTHLDGITCLSSHVEKILIDNGVTVPLLVSGCGVDHWERIVPQQGYTIEAKRFRFLHVSSCFPRKGVDVMLDAYASAFTDRDDVTLIIKTFENPHNQIYSLIEEKKSKYPNFPHVLVIQKDMQDSELKALYRECHVLLAPSKAEGFGLPIAEAMLDGLAVVTTGWGGQLDFCDEESAWLIDFEFERAQTHFHLFDSVWAKPDTTHLAQILKQLYNMDAGSLKQKSQKAREKLLSNFKWIDTATRLASASKIFADFKPKKPKIGWVSTYNVKCGIATYSQHFITNMKEPVTIFAARADEYVSRDDEHILRCYSSKKDDSLSELAAKVDAENIDVLVIQFNYGFFDFYALNEFIKRQKQKNRVVVMTMHSTTDTIDAHNWRLSELLPALSICDRLLVHTIKDLNNLKKLGLVENVSLFAHPILDYTPILTDKKSDNTLRLASYGFLLPHKGLEELLDAVYILRNNGLDVELLMLNALYPAPISSQLCSALQAKINKQGMSSYVNLVTHFLPDEVTLKRLSEVDLALFPYQQTGESASGAVRQAIAAGTAVAVSPLPIFEDVLDAVFVMDGFDATSIANFILHYKNLLKSQPQLIESKREQAKAWKKNHTYSHLSNRLYRMLQALHTKNLLKEKYASFQKSKFQLRDHKTT